MESLIKKFQTLQNKTTTSGCTEQEALHAAEKVAELLDKYGLSIEPDGSGKEPLGCGDVPALAQEKVDRSTSFIHCAIEVHPLAFDLDIGLVHEMPAPEQFLCRSRFRHSRRYRWEPNLSSLHQNRAELFLSNDCPKSNQ